MPDEVKQQIRTIHQIKPKNGKWLVALIAGAPADRARELRDKLAAARGILAKHHWDYERKSNFSGDVPAEVDLVLIIKSQIGHSNQDRVLLACKKAHVPFVRTTHKWISIDHILRIRFAISKVDPLPIEIRTGTPLHEMELQSQEPNQAPLPQPLLLPQKLEPITVRVENAHLYNNPSHMSKFMALVTAAQEAMLKTEVGSCTLTTGKIEVCFKEQLPIGVTSLQIANDFGKVVKVSGDKLHRATKGGTIDDAILAALQQDNDIQLAEISRLVSDLLDRVVNPEQISCNLARLYRNSKILRTGSRHHYAYRSLPLHEK